MIVDEDVKAEAREHLGEIKRRFVAGDLTLEQARDQDDLWTRILVGAIPPTVGRIMCEVWRP